MKGTLREALDILRQTERDVLASVGVRGDARERARRARSAGSQRWAWIMERAVRTAFEPASDADVALGRDA